MTNLDWMSAGHCAQIGAAVWDRTDPLTQLRICRRCPVRDQCLSWSLKLESQSATRIGGVVGGTIDDDRRRYIESRTTA